MAVVYQSLRASSLGGCGSFMSSMPMTLGESERVLTRIRSMSMVCDLLRWSLKNVGGLEVPECESGFCLPGAAWRSS